MILEELEQAVATWGWSEAPYGGHTSWKRLLAVEGAQTSSDKPQLLEEGWRSSIESQEQQDETTGRQRRSKGDMVGRDNGGGRQRGRWRVSKGARVREFVFWHGREGCYGMRKMSFLCLIKSGWVHDGFGLKLK